MVCSNIGAIAAYKRFVLPPIKEMVKSGQFNTIYEVAYALGYSKSDYFSAIYKKRYGVLPNADFVSLSSREEDL